MNWVVANAANRLYHGDHCQPGVVGWRLILKNNKPSTLDTHEFSREYN